MANVVETYTIDASQIDATLKRTDELARLMKKSLQEIGQEFREISKTTVDASGTLEKYSGAIEKSGVKNLKEFRQEQRLQSYVMRESTQAITNMIFALSFLNQGQDEASSKAKAVTQALMVGVAAQNSMEFALYGVGRAAQNMSGALGRALMSVSSMAGPISIAIGMLALLVTAFHDTGESAKKTQEEIDKWYAKAKEQYEGYGINQLERILEDVKRRYGELMSEQLVYMATESEKIRTGGGKKGVRAQAEAINIARENIAAIKEAYEQTRIQMEGTIKYLQEQIDALRHTEEVKRRQELSKYEDELAKLTSKYPSIFAGAPAKLAQEDITKLTEKKVEAETKSLDINKKIANVKEVEVKAAESIERAVQESNRAEQEYIWSLQSSLNVLIDGLSAVDSSASYTLARIAQIMQTIITLKQYLDVMQAGENVVGGIGALGSILKIFGLFAGFQGGGYTGAGRSKDVAGVVHRGEIVFEQNIVRNHYNELMSLRNSLRANPAQDFLLSYNTAAISGSGANITGELRALRSDVKALKDGFSKIPAPIITINNPVTFEDALKRKMPDYEKWRAKKTA